LNLEQEAIEAAIKAEIVVIAETLGADASDLQADEVIPATGLIDSAGLLDLLAWFENHYAFRIPAEELTIDNLGTLAAMATYLRRRKGLA
jgi:D-alanine--poly(phosphoribitol) ligase subunit 2